MFTSRISDSEADASFFKLLSIPTPGLPLLLSSLVNASMVDATSSSGNIFNRSSHRPIRGDDDVDEDNDNDDPLVLSSSSSKNMITNLSGRRMANPRSVLLLIRVFVSSISQSFYF